MQRFDRLSIEEISKRDLLMILEALEYTGEKTDINSFIELRDSIVENLSKLMDTQSTDVLNYLEAEVKKEL